VGITSVARNESQVGQSLINFSVFDLKSLRDQFMSAIPVPHVVIDGGMNDVELLSKSFPRPDWPHWSALAGEYELNKYFCREIELFPNELLEAIRQLTSSRFLQVLEKITGIEALIPDPHFEGGGLHLSTEGGILAPHTDFHIYDRLNLYRQINLILYISDSWELGDGGTLRLWDSHNSNPNAEEAKIDPLPGRMVIFKTDDRSVHGFTDPVGPRKLRKSIALYYYTAVDNGQFSGDFTTFWRHEGGIRKGSIRVFLYKLLLVISRAFSFLAHLVNPRLGMRWWRARSKQRQ
jgi:2OG-Fe(II) oxygenase superfamily